MTTVHFHLQPHYKYELFHTYFTNKRLLALFQLFLFRIDPKRTRPKNSVWFGKGVSNRFRHLRFNYLKVKTTSNDRAKETK